MRLAQTYVSSNLDANSALAVTSTFDLDYASDLWVSFCVIAVSGSHNNHIIEIVCSFDGGTTWDAVGSGGEVTGRNSLMAPVQIAATKIQFRVKTVEGAASVVKIYATVKG